MNTKKSQEYFFKEGCFIEEWHNSADDEAMSIAKVRVLAQSVTKLHSLTNTTERYIILDGHGEVTVADKSWLVKKGDVVVIEPGHVQNIHNVGATDLLFLAICTPRFKLENYHQLED